MCFWLANVLIICNRTSKCTYVASVLIIYACQTYIRDFNVSAAVY
jgi:hypothetical protein